MSLIKKDFSTSYFEELFSCLKQIDNYNFNQALEYIEKISKSKNKVILAGNGGSAAIASHAALDFTKAAGIKSICFNESSLITCFGNDYGYENWIQKALSFFYDKGDLVILISSSGNSPNIINAANYIQTHSGKLITFSGFNERNKLRKKGNVNFYVKSSKYNMVENTHQIWLLSLIDCFIEKKKK